MTVRLAKGGIAGTYLLQAAIAAEHARASTAEVTDWPRIAALYQKLQELDPSPVIPLNHAVAVAMSGRLTEGLARIDDLKASGDLDRYYLLHATRADILRRMKRLDEAVASYREALALATNVIEQEFLRRRLQELDSLGNGLGS